MSAAIRAGCIYFAAVFALGFVLGTLRVLVIIPAVGELAAVAIEIPIMLVGSWVFCGLVIKRCAVPEDLGARVLTGGLAFGLLMVAEVGVSVFAFGRTFADHFGNYQNSAEQLGLGAQIIFGMFPALRLRKI